MAAFSTEAVVKVKQKALADTRKAKTQAFLKALFSYLAQHKNRTELAFVNLGSELSSSTEYATASTGNLYAIFLKNRDASIVYGKFTSTASAITGASLAGTTIKIPASDEVLVCWPDGLALAAGLSVRVDTSSSAAAEPTTAATGFAIVG